MHEITNTITASKIHPNHPFENTIVLVSINEIKTIVKEVPTVQIIRFITSIILLSSTFFDIKYEYCIVRNKLATKVPIITPVIPIKFINNSEIVKLRIASTADPFFVSL